MKTSILITLVDKNYKEQIYCIRHNIKNLQRTKIYKELDLILSQYHCAKFYYKNSEFSNDYETKIKTLPYSSNFLGEF